MEKRCRYIVEESLGDLGLIFEAIVEKGAGEAGTEVSLSLILYDDVKGSFFGTKLERHELVRLINQLYELLEEIPLPPGTKIG